jgi:hypothetical protein
MAKQFSETEVAMSRRDARSANRRRLSLVAFSLRQFGRVERARA